MVKEYIATQSKHKATSQVNRRNRNEWAEEERDKSHQHQCV